MSVAAEGPEGAESFPPFERAALRLFGIERVPAPDRRLAEGGGRLARPVLDLPGVVEDVPGGAPDEVARRPALAPALAEVR